MSQWLDPRPIFILVLPSQLVRLKRESKSPTAPGPKRSGTAKKETTMKGKSKGKGKTGGKGKGR